VIGVDYKIIVEETFGKSLREIMHEVCVEKNWRSGRVRITRCPLANLYSLAFKI